MAKMYEKPRGTRDLLGLEMEAFQAIETVARKTFEAFAYQEIRTPIFEQTELFTRSVGEATDIVSKEIYAFKDRGDRDLALRPEGTAGVVRAFIENGQQLSGGACRWYYIGPMFRYDRPQKGRYRQFWQLGCELLGSSSLYADLEILQLAHLMSEGMGLKGLTFKVNSLGTEEDRRNYQKILVDYLESRSSELTDDGRQRMKANPLRLFDTKVKEDLKVLEDAPRIWDTQSAKSRERVEQVVELAYRKGTDFKIDKTIMRGLDYYTGLVFEVTCSDLGAQSAVLGGGRYDNLIEQLGGKPTPAVGFAAGIDRLVLAKIAASKKPPEVESEAEICVISNVEEGMSLASTIAYALRKPDFCGDCEQLLFKNVKTNLEPKSMKSLMKMADKSGASFAVILGEDEKKTRSLILRNLKTGDQTPLEAKDKNPSDIAEEILKLCKETNKQP